MRRIAVVLAAALFACGEDHVSGGPDASPDSVTSPGECWPLIDHVPKGSATLGTGWNDFEVMPDVVPIEYGTQDGYMMAAHVRMTGFDPGDPNDVFEPRNPRTRIRAFFEDPIQPDGGHPARTSHALNVYAYCAFRTGYRPVGDGTYELSTGVPIIFDTCWRSDNVIGRRIRIELEILDDSGGYAKDVKVVTAGTPVGYYPADEQNSPGCNYPVRPGPAIQDP